MSTMYYFCLDCLDRSARFSSLQWHHDHDLSYLIVVCSRFLSVVCSVESSSVVWLRLKRQQSVWRAHLGWWAPSVDVVTRVTLVCNYRSCRSRKRAEEDFRSFHVTGVETCRWSKRVRRVIFSYSALIWTISISQREMRIRLTLSSFVFAPWKSFINRDTFKICWWGGERLTLRLLRNS